MEEPRISLIIPAYNEEKYIGKTMESIKCAIQAYGNTDDVEVIVVNNNSSDDTEKIAQEHGATIIFEPENHIVKARNRGAYCATGKYLIFVDAMIWGLQKKLRNKAYCEKIWYDVRR